MTAFGVAEFAAGLLLAFLTLRDVVDTAVVPGRTGGALKILRRIVRFSLPLWRRGRTPAQGISTAFAPSALVKAFVLWMAFLTLGFGLMVHALAFSFEPALPSFPQALFVAGSGLVTVGLSETDAMGWARWVVMASGFCGFAVVTLSVTYLLQVQEALAGRDTAVLKLMTSAGKPPSGLGLLERYADLGCVDDLGDLMREARTWCAQTAQSHASHPSLIYFRSAGTACGWPAALGAMLDLSLIVERLIDRPDWRGQAVLLRDEGRAMIERVMASSIWIIRPSRPARRRSRRFCGGWGPPVIPCAPTRTLKPSGSKGDRMSVAYAGWAITSDRWRLLWFPIRRADPGFSAVDYPCCPAG